MGEWKPPRIRYPEGELSIVGRPRPANYSAIPTVTYTDPEVASVGISNPARAPEGMDVVTRRR
ncbi:MAG: hypothetical protein JOZ41_14195 [Chloroflexi bacterium]|nr:hypothetical protein [Chloroflexota bacterium]